MNEINYTVDIDDVALEQALILAKIDPEGVALVLARIDLLGANPRPTGAFPYGPNAVRLHVGFYRVLAAIEDEAAKVVITHIGRAS